VVIWLRVSREADIGESGRLGREGFQAERMRRTINDVRRVIEISLRRARR